MADDQLPANARQWLIARLVVIRHTNLPTVTDLYGQIVDILRSRSLVPARPPPSMRCSTAPPGASGRSDRQVTP